MSSSSSELMDDDDNGDGDGEKPGLTAPRGLEQALGPTLNWNECVFASSADSVTFNWHECFFVSSVDSVSSSLYDWVVSKSLFDEAGFLFRGRPFLLIL